MPDLDLMLLRRRVDRLLAPWGGRGPGVTLGIVLDGQLVVHCHAGLASIEHGVPIGSATRFRIASVSKQFTCAAVLILAGEGRLGLDDDARTHLPELPALADRVTVAQLMHNTSGIRDMLEIMRQGGADLGTPVRPDDLMAGICRQRRLNFTPGTRFLYSNSNFLLLGRIAERVSGVPLPQLLEQRIFALLGMTATAMTEDVHAVVPDLATGYLPDGAGGWRRAAHAFPLGGEGGLVSSVEDLALWDRNFATRRVGAAWLDELTRQTPFSNGTINRYARGLVLRPYRGADTVSHGGLWPGFRTEFLRVPSHGVTVIAVSNCGSADPNLLAHRALDAVLDGRPGVHPAPSPLSPVATQGLAGRFLDAETGTTLDIAVSDTDHTAGQVSLTINGLTVVAEPTEDGRLASPRANAVLALRPLGPDAVEVEQDAGRIATWRRVPPGAAMPPGLPGTYHSAEMAACWTVADTGGGLTVRATGPVCTGPQWRVEPIAADLVRVHVPTSLMPAWLDVRVLRDPDGTVRALEVSGARAKQVCFARHTEPHGSG